MKSEDNVFDLYNRAINVYNRLSLPEGSNPSEVLNGIVSMLIVMDQTSETLEPSNKIEISGGKRVES